VDGSGEGLRFFLGGLLFLLGEVLLEEDLDDLDPLLLRLLDREEELLLLVERDLDLDGDRERDLDLDGDFVAITVQQKRRRSACC